MGQRFVGDRADDLSRQAGVALRFKLSPVDNFSGGVSHEKRLLMKVVTSFPMVFRLFLKNSLFSLFGPGLFQVLRFCTMVVI